MRTDNRFYCYSTKFSLPRDLAPEIYVLLPCDTCIVIAVLLMCRTSSWCHLEEKFYDVVISGSGFDYRTIRIFIVRCDDAKL